MTPAYLEFPNLYLPLLFNLLIFTITYLIACVAGPQFYGGPDLQRAGFWRAWGRIEGLQERPPFMTTRPSHNIINGFLKLTNKNSAAIGENPGRQKYLRLHVNMSIKH